MTNWTYQFIVCGENVTGNEHYLFTIKDEDTCLLVSDTRLEGTGDSTIISQIYSTIITIVTLLRNSPEILTFWINL